MVGLVAVNLVIFLYLVRPEVLERVKYWESAQLIHDKFINSSCDWALVLTAFN
jgi:hypothetical protein